MLDEAVKPPEVLREGGENVDLISFLVLYAKLTDQAVTRYVRSEVTNEGGLMDQMQDRLEYRKVLLHQVHEHWEVSLIGREAFDALMGNQETRELGLELSSMYQNYGRSSVEDKVLPWHESMRLVHPVMANVYGVSFVEQQVLTPEIGNLMRQTR